MKAEETRVELAKLSGDGSMLVLRKLVEVRPDQKTNTKIDATVSFQDAYQNWYTRCVRVLRALMPERLSEYVECYEPDPKRKSINPATYTIRDHLWGLSVGSDNMLASVYMKLQHQQSIVSALLATFDDRIRNIEQTLRADLFDNELDAAQDLLGKGHLRAAGTLAGVVLEAHLSAFSAAKGLQVRKKSPTISDYNEKLKEAGVIDVPTWRHVQRLGDIRNLSAHKKEREPTKDEVQDLITGTKKMTTELF